MSSPTIPQNGRAASSTSRLTQASTLINRGGIPLHPTSSPPPVPSEIARALDTYEAQFLPHAPRSLSGIALRAFTLGASLAISTLVSLLLLLYLDSPFWRAPFFIASLCLFHFLEFWTTALTNTPNAKTSSFLLLSNGWAYNAAHTASFVETLVTHYFFPEPVLPSLAHYALLFTGLALLVMGQVVRARAMVEAGRSFNHIVAHTKQAEHKLITTGLYSILRHPSYFGFFWWGIGSQLVMGNSVCLLGYWVVLYRFFSRRIEGEEELLVRFFGKEYEDFRNKTSVGIPGIR